VIAESLFLAVCENNMENGFMKRVILGSLVAATCLTGAAALAD
jgi:hypothetical protein